jgi:hypothetical protein
VVNALRAPVVAAQSLGAPAAVGHGLAALAGPVVNALRALAAVGHGLAAGANPAVGGSPAAREGGGASADSVLIYATRHARPRLRGDKLRRASRWIPAFAGMTERKPNRTLR